MLCEKLAAWHGLLVVVLGNTVRGVVRGLGCLDVKSASWVWPLLQTKHYVTSMLASRERGREGGRGWASQPSDEGCLLQLRPAQRRRGRMRGRGEFQGYGEREGEFLVGK